VNEPQPNASQPTPPRNPLNEHELAKAVELFQRDPAAVLSAIYPGPVCCIGVDRNGMVHMAQQAATPAELFTVLVATAQTVGEHCGMRLGWVQQPASRQIIVPRGMEPPTPPRGRR